MVRSPSRGRRRVSSVGSPSPPLSSGGPRVLIVGAGFGGIAAAALLMRAGFSDLLLLERNAQVGGVWEANRYPGCACDVPAPLYSFSFAQNADWSSRFPPQQEIQQYLEDCVDRFGLRPQLRVGRDVVGAEWDEVAAVWRVRVRDADGTVSTEVADVLVPAVGQLSRPVIPALPGNESFEGPSFHTADWPAELHLAGARVAVVGTGASAIQLVPAIAGIAGDVTVFQRSAPWTLPKPTHRYAKGRRVFRRFPALMRLPRFGFWLVTSWAGRAIIGRPLSARLLRLVSNAQRRVQVRDRTLRAQVTPDSALGCKRVLFTTDWFPTLARPDVTLVTAAIETVTATGLRTADDVVHEADIIVYGTGFEAGQRMVPIDIVGRAGVLLADTWAEGAHAHLGMTVPGFPNMLLMYGPNTNTGNASVVLFLEAQARYLVQLVTELARRRTGDPAASVEVRAEIESRSNAELQRRLATSVWASCANWYRSASGRIVTNWPGSSFEYRRRTAHLDLADLARTQPPPRSPTHPTPTPPSPATANPPHPATANPPPNPRFRRESAR